MKAETGVEKVVIFDHTLRIAKEAPRGVGLPREPVLRVHNDYTLKSGPQRVRDLLPADEAAARLKRRFAIVNVWRPIVGPLQHMPLAFCDAGTFRAEDAIATDLIYPDRVGEIYSIAYNPAQRWFYFPEMQRNEAVLIKTYDSDPDCARFTAHSAFADPNFPAPAVLREEHRAPGAGVLGLTPPRLTPACPEALRHGSVVTMQDGRSGCRSSGAY